MNAKERAKIYLKAAKGLDCNKWFLCCKAIAAICLGNSSKWDYVTDKNFPELHLFNPNKKKFYGSGWWGYDSQSERVLALLFAHQIALHP